MTNSNIQNYKGRKKIFVDVNEVNKNNICSVLKEAYTTHLQNKADIDFLINYELGEEPLSRVKSVREDIDIQDVENLAHYITEFKTSYNWGNPITYIKRKDLNEITEKGITDLNNLLEITDFTSISIEVLREMEIVGISYLFIDVSGDEERPFRIAPISSRYAFKVRRNDIEESPLFDVVYRVLKDGTIYFDVFTEYEHFLIKNGYEIVEDKKENVWVVEDVGYYKNVMGMLPLIEFKRSPDITGCFEREINALNSLNTMASDFCNSVSQEVQSVWWGNDVEFETDENGNVKTPKSNEFVLTQTTASGKTPLIQALSSSVNYQAITDKISYSANSILTRCFVPVLTDLNGGSSGTAMSMSSGWTQAEANAQKQEKLIKKPMYEFLKRMLKAIEICSNNKELKKLKAEELEPKIIRNKTYDLNTKVNSFVALINVGVQTKDALEITDLAGDVAQIIENSGETIGKYQKSKVYAEKKQENNNNEQTIESKTSLQDNSQQVNNSPILKGQK